MIESSWLRAIEIGERPQLQDTVRGRGSFLPAHNLAVLHASLGAEAEAARWRAREAAMRKAAMRDAHGDPNWRAEAPHFRPSPGSGDTYPAPMTSIRPA